MIFLFQKTLIFAVPLLIVALAGLFAERSGIINIALDGIMITGSFVGALTAYLLRGNPFFVDHNQLTFVISLFAAALSGAVFSLLLSFSAINLKADQTIGGTALNLLAPALSLFFIKILFFKDKLEMTGMPDSTGKSQDFGFVILNPDLSSVGQVFLDKAYISTFISIGLFVLLSIWIYKTRTGLRLRSCGEHPQAAASVGINVNRMRYLGTTISGALAGFGGYAYIAAVANGTASGAVEGMGFLALAIMIFGNWKPLGIALGALLFGFLKCLGVVSSQLSLTIGEQTVYPLKELGLPMYFYNLIPYIAVLLVLAFASKRSRPPKAEGIPYDKGMR
ncbi:MAG: ABC transporter permease [Clostridia bacterium]|nr:ABC transporter permease [Clostridia bacterium]